MRVAFTNRKGGVGKTTSAVFVAAGLAAGGSTLLVDGDRQGSALRWADLAELPFSIADFPTRALARQVMMQPHEHVVIDTPPGSEDVIRSALRAADLAVVPVQPTTADVAQLGQVLDLLEEARELNPRLRAVFLLTRVVLRTRALQQTEAYFGQHPELRLLRTRIPQAQRYALALGQPITDLMEYGPVVDELLEASS